MQKKKCIYNHRSIDIYVLALAHWKTECLNSRDTTQKRRMNFFFLFFFRFFFFEFAIFNINFSYYFFSFVFYFFFFLFSRWFNAYIYFWFFCFFVAHLVARQESEKPKKRWHRRREHYINTKVSWTKCCREREHKTTNRRKWNKIDHYFMCKYIHLEFCGSRKTNKKKDE